MNERSLFLAALEIGDAERRAEFLRDACGEDADLRRSVEELLQANAAAGSFMGAPAGTIGAAAADTDPASPISLDFLAASDQPGSLGRLGNYEITRAIGQGGMGIVLEGRDTRLDRVVAVKVLAPQLAAGAAARHRFLREAKAAAAVRDEHVVTIYAVEETEGLPYLVMELIAGQSLQERIDREGPLELKEILRIGVQTARGLAAAHAHGLIHRDVKPANILLENGVERVKLTDFGLARVADDASLTGSGVIAGTPQYMSPEQAKGESVDTRSDLFSLGCVLYAMCTGRPPFRADSTVATLRRVCDENPRPIRELEPEIPQWLAAVVERLLAKKPEERLQPALEAVEILGHHLAELQHATRATPQETHVPRSPVSPQGTDVAQLLSRRWIAVAAVLLGLLIALSLTELTGVTRFLAAVIVAVGNENERPPVTSSGRGKQADKLQHEVPANSRDNPPRVTAPQAPRLAKELRRFDGHEAVVWSVAFSPDGSRALSGCGGQFRNSRMSLGSDFSVRLWDVASGRQLQLFTGHQHQVQSVAFTADGSHVVGAGKIWAWRRWNIQTGQEVASLRGAPAPPFFHLTLAGDATRLLSFGGADKVLRLWDVNASAELWKVEGLPEDISAAAFSKDGRYVATAGGGRFDQSTFQSNPGADYSIRLWDAASGKEELRLRGHAAFVRGLAFLPDGRRLISAGADTVLRLWDLQTRQELRAYSGHTRGINAVAVTPDGRWVLSGSGDTSVRLWNIETGKEVCRYEGHTGEVRAVAISPDGRFALSGGYDEALRLWELPEPEEKEQ